jgi:RNA polymerase sigma-70 factor, ECF subfamily
MDRSQYSRPPVGARERFTLAAKGDVPALAQLLELYRPFLLECANGELDANLRQKIGASDVVQNAMIKATFAFPEAEFADLQRFVAWLQSIVHNEVLMADRYFRQSQKRDARREQPLYGSHTQALLRKVSSRGGEANNLVRAEELQELRLAIDGLPQHEREIIRSRALRELSFNEIAEIVDRTPDAVRMLYNRAIEKLKHHLSRSKPI